VRLPFRSDPEGKLSLSRETFDAALRRALSKKNFVPPLDWLEEDRRLTKNGGGIRQR